MTRRIALSIMAGAAIVAGACTRAEHPLITGPQIPAASTASTASAMETIGNHLPDSVLVLVNGQERTRADIATIPTSSIQNVEILKGAAAVSAYGERAKKGIILITTKAGAALKP